MVAVQSGSYLSLAGFSYAHGCVRFLPEAGDTSFFDTNSDTEEEVTLDLVGYDFSAIVNEVGIPDGRGCNPDGEE